MAVTAASAEPAGPAPLDLAHRTHLADELGEFQSHPDRFGARRVFVGAMGLTAAMMFDMAWFREQTCIVLCPYGRLQSVLTDSDTLVIGYDAARGEPRGKAKDGRPVDIYTCSVQDLIDAGVMFCGTPDQVYAQIVDFCEYCGGMGNLLMMGHAGFLSHEDTVSNLEIFAKEVMPRLKDWKQPEPAASAA